MKNILRSGLEWMKTVRAPSVAETSQMQSAVGSETITHSDSSATITTLHEITRGVASEISVGEISEPAIYSRMHQDAPTETHSAPSSFAKEAPVVDFGAIDTSILDLAIAEAEVEESEELATEAAPELEAPALVTEPLVDKGPALPVTLVTRGGRSYATCPHCQGMFNIRDRLVDPRTLRVNVLKQLDCPACEKHVTLPDDMDPKHLRNTLA